MRNFRSEEAKALGIKVGDPVHHVRNFFWREDVTVCSANFALYGDMSSRMMRTLSSVVPKLAVYSIDEGFAICDGMSDEQLHSMTLEAGFRVKQWCGLGTGAGIGPTLTLAKLASYAAKRVTRSSLCNLMGADDRLSLLRLTPVSEVWGSGLPSLRNSSPWGLRPLPSSPPHRDTYWSGSFPSRSFARS